MRSYVVEILEDPRIETLLLIVPGESGYWMMAGIIYLIHFSLQKCFDTFDDSK